jgi:NADH-quinone oxidoreductase subunit M
MFNEHLLTIIIFAPLLFGFIALLMNEKMAKWVCTIGAAVTLLASIPLYTGFGDAETLHSQYKTLQKKIVAKHVEKYVREDSSTANSVILTAVNVEKVPQATEDVITKEGWGLAYKKASRECRELYLAVAGPRSDMARQIRFVEYGDWIPVFNIHYFVGVDGLSLPLIFLTALLTLICLVYSWNFDGDKKPEDRRPLKAYFILFLLLEAGLLGVFCSLDLFLFYVFWEIVLLPSYFLIGIWGGPNRNYAALKFFIYTLVGSVLMLIAMLALYWRDPALPTFNMLSLVGMSGTPLFSGPFMMWIFVAMFAAFAVKVPVFPFHTWLPDAHVQAPTAFSVMLAGVMLKMGGYGFFRLAYPLCPEAATHPIFVYGVGTLGLIGLLYGAFVALGQSDFKSLVAYSSVSHMGYVMLGMAALTPAAMTGASLQMFNHGASSAMMFLVVGVIYDRAHHRDLNRFGGLALQMPWYFGLAVVAFFASLGLPGLNGFISEFLVFFGAFNSEHLPTWMVIAAIPGIVFTAVYILWTIKRVFLGDLTNEKYKKFADLTFQESFALWPLAIICIVVGVYPRIILDPMGPAIEAILKLATNG